MEDSMYPPLPLFKHPSNVVDQQKLSMFPLFLQELFLLEAV